MKKKSIVLDFLIKARTGNDENSKRFKLFKSISLAAKDLQVKNLLRKKSKENVLHRGKG